MNADGKSVYVLSAGAGNSGGAPMATLLLSESLARIGFRTTLFATVEPSGEVGVRLRRAAVEVRVPRVRVGWRFLLPQRLNAFNCWTHCFRNVEASVVSVGLIPEARFLLALPRTAPIHLWETTEGLPGSPFQDSQIRARLGKAASLIAPSSTIAGNLRSTYGWRGPIGVLPFWTAIPQSRDVMPTDRSRCFVFLGRLDMAKGLAVLAKALRIVQGEYAGVSLTICGAGPVGPVEGLFEGMKGVQIRGFISDKELDEVLRRSVAVVLPSFSEGYPLALLEACGRGRPVVATRVGSIPEVFGDRRCAELVPARDHQALATAMTKMISESEDDYRERCLDAAELFKQRCSPEGIQRTLSCLMGPSRDGAHTSKDGPHSGSRT